MACKRILDTSTLKDGGSGKNKIIVIDPNCAKGDIENTTVNHEDLNIFVSLEVKTKGKSLIISDKNAPPTGQDVSKTTSFDFLTPRNKDNTAKQSLTTDWTEIGGLFSDSNLGKDNEGFGITNIDIDINASHVPKIVIDFTDIRGATLFEQGSCGKYSVFFHLPYPVFELTVKGFYGEPVKWYLNLVKFNTKFNSESGNFESRGEFIGWSYAFLADMMMGYAMAAPYMEEIAAKDKLELIYGKTQKYFKNLLGEDEYQTLLTSTSVGDTHNGNTMFCDEKGCMTIIKLLQKINKLEGALGSIGNTEDIAKLKDNFTLQENLKSLLIDLNNFKGELGKSSKKTSSLGFEKTTVSLGPHEYGGIDSTVEETEVWVRKKLESGNPIKKNIEDLMTKYWGVDGLIPNRVGVILQTEILDKENSVNPLNLFSDSRESDFLNKLYASDNFQNNLIKGATQATPFDVYEISSVGGVTEAPIDNTTNTSNIFGDTVAPEVVATNNQLTSSSGNYYAINFFDFEKVVGQEFKKISNLIKEDKKRIGEGINEVVKNTLGFTPSIRNVFIIMCCNVELFNLLLLDTTIEAEKEHNIQYHGSITGNDTPKKKIDDNDPIKVNLINGTTKVWPWPTYTVESSTSEEQFTTSSTKYTNPPKAPTKPDKHVEQYPGESGNNFDWPEVIFVEEFVNGMMRLKKDLEALSEDKSGIPGFDNYAPITPLETKLHNNNLPLKYRGIDEDGINEVYKTIGERMFISLDYNFFNPLYMSQESLTNPSYVAAWNKKDTLSIKEIGFTPLSSDGVKLSKSLAELEANNIVNSIENVDTLNVLLTNVKAGNLGESIHTHLGITSDAQKKVKFSDIRTSGLTEFTGGDTQSKAFTKITGIGEDTEFTSFKPINKHIILGQENFDSIYVYPNPYNSEDKNIVKNLFRIFDDNEVSDAKGITITENDEQGEKFKLLLKEYKGNLNDILKNDASTAAIINSTEGVLLDEKQKVFIYNQDRLFIALKPGEIKRDKDSDSGTPTAASKETPLDNIDSSDLLYCNYIENENFGSDPTGFNITTNIEESQILDGFDHYPSYGGPQAEFYKLKDTDLPDNKEGSGKEARFEYQEDLGDNNELVANVLPQLPLWLDNVNSARKMLGGDPLSEVTLAYDTGSKTYDTNEVQDRNLAYLFLDGFMPSPLMSRAVSEKDGHPKMFNKAIVPFINNGSLVEVPKAWLLGFGANLWRYRNFVGVKGDGSWNRISDGDQPTGRDTLSQPGYPITTAPTKPIGKGDFVTTDLFDGGGDIPLTGYLGGAAAIAVGLPFLAAGVAASYILYNFVNLSTQSDDRSSKTMDEYLDENIGFTIKSDKFQNSSFPKSILDMSTNHIKNFIEGENGAKIGGSEINDNEEFYPRGAYFDYYNFYSTGNTSNSGKYWAVDGGKVMVGVDDISTYEIEIDGQEQTISTFDSPILGLNYDNSNKDNKKTEETPLRLAGTEYSKNTYWPFKWSAPWNWGFYLEPQATVYDFYFTDAQDLEVQYQTFPHYNMFEQQEYVSFLPKSHNPITKGLITQLLPVRNELTTGSLGWVMERIPDKIKDIIIDKFDNWVKNQFQAMKEEIDPINFGDNLLNTKYTHSSDAEGIGGENDSVARLVLKEDFARDLLKLLTEKYTILNATPKIWWAINPDKDIKDEYKDTFNTQTNLIDVYIKALTEKLKVLIPKTKAKLEKEQSDELRGSLFGDEDVKLSLYRSFKSLNDKWISMSEGGVDYQMFFNIKDKQCIKEKKDGIDRSTVPLIAHFSFVNRTMGDIGDVAVLDVRTMMDIANNPTMSFYQVIDRIMKTNQFNFFPLPSFSNFTNAPTIPSGTDNEKISGEDGYLANMFEPSTSWSCIESGPHFVCMFAGGSSSILNMGSGGSNCVIDQVEMNNLQDGILDITDPTQIDKTDFNKEGASMTVFKVAYGQENQNHFKSIQLDQAEFTETQESLMIIDKLAKGGDPSKKTSKGQNLHNIYQTRSYKSTVETMGNMMIQPMMYYQLENVPMFNGLYMILDVKHSVKANTVSTTFTGVRQPRVTVPLVKDIVTAMNIDLGDLGDSNGTPSGTIDGIRNNTSASGGNYKYAGGPDTVKYGCYADYKIEPNEGLLYQNRFKGETDIYGMKEMGMLMEDWGTKWYANSKKQTYGDKIYVRAFGGYKGGGNAKHSGNSSHYYGLGVDYRAIAPNKEESTVGRNSNKKTGTAANYDINYSREGTRDLLILLFKLLKDKKYGGLTIKQIFWQDPVLQSEYPGVVKPMVDHSNHMHITFNIPKRVKDLVDGGQKCPDTLISSRPKTVATPPNDIIKAMKDYGITDPLEKAHFLSQIAHESNFNAKSENLNYGVGKKVDPEKGGLLGIFGKYFPTEASTVGFARTKDPDVAANQEKIGNKVYANRNGNGDEASGDGYKYRGRGYIQLTGREAYQKYQDYLTTNGKSYDIMSKPNLINTTLAGDSAAWFWKHFKNNLTTTALKGDKSENVIAVTQIVNGGQNGIEDRKGKFLTYNRNLKANPKLYS